jgi:hypothetical protein
MTLFQESGGTAEDRRSEADKLIEMSMPFAENMSPWEQNFLNDLSDGRPISPRMIFKLRDIADKYAR